jgi:hypothetical protein
VLIATKPTAAAVEFTGGAGLEVLAIKTMRVRHLQTHLQARDGLRGSAWQLHGILVDINI